MDAIFLFSDGGFGEARKPTIHGGEEVAIHVRLRESLTLDDGLCEQPRGLQVVARGLC